MHIPGSYSTGVTESIHEISAFKEIYIERKSDDEIFAENEKLSISIVSEVECLDSIFPKNNLNMDYDFDIGDPALELKKLKFKNQKRLIISHLNINSLRNNLNQ